MISPAMIYHKWSLGISLSDYLFSGIILLDIMFAVLKITNQYLISLFSLILIFLVGFTDYKTGSEISFSVFYLVPLAFLSLYKGSKVPVIIFASILAGAVWLIADYLTDKQYSSMIILFWNGLVRLIIFLLVTILLYRLKTKQKELVDANKRLTHLNYEKNKYLGIAAHDLRNPMGTIVSFSDLIMNDPETYPVNPDTLEILKLLKQTSENSMDLLKDLLDISKIESGEIELNLKQSDYKEFLGHQIRISQMLANTKDIIIQSEFPDEQIMLNFDQHYLVEVITNLLSNAIKYSYPHSFVIVRVTLHDDLVKTEIIDHGVGIPEDEHKLLFRIFQKTSARTTAGESSTGLGLAIAKKVVLLHNGTIDVFSRKNEGSNFYFTLPQ